MWTTNALYGTVRSKYKRTDIHLKNYKQTELGEFDIENIRMNERTHKYDKSI